MPRGARQPLILHTSGRCKNICFLNPGVSALRPLILFDLRAVMHMGFRELARCRGCDTRLRIADQLQEIVQSIFGRRPEAVDSGTRRQRVLRRCFGGVDGRCGFLRGRNG